MSGLVFGPAELLSHSLKAGTMPVGRDHWYEYLGGVSPADWLAYGTTVDEIVLDVPMCTLSARLPVWSLLALLQLHGGVISRRSRTRERIRSLLDAHICNVSCVNTFSRFRICHHACADTTTSPPLIGTPQFPPDPLGTYEKAEIISRWCEAFAPEKIRERICVVCGRLISISMLRTLRLGELDVDVLTRRGEGVTRAERQHRTDSGHEVDGPILYQAATVGLGANDNVDVCTTCSNVLKRKRLPKESLANGLWLGEVPDILQEANFLERLVMAKVRHNFFVAKVNKGQRKMCANAVMFAQPVARVFAVLPPPKHELDECLAILFVGACPPTPSDMQRTPFLVRQRVVYDGLMWLRNNHADYASIEISRSNLETYPDGESPVCVIHHATEGDAPAESMSVFDGENEKGTEEGRCSFAIHGLTGCEFVRMSYEEKITTALRYFERGSQVLAYGHDAEPQSIYHNPALFPSMFPWLFPYGLGGFENGHIRTRLDRITHVRHLLLYGDRRFQTDECFCFMVFNHEQIRASTHGGYLLTSRKNFPAVVDKILNLDVSTLDGLIERGRNGEYVRSQSDNEKRCFELMSIVDHIAGHVQGSATNCKYQRNEIKSLIIELGVPVFFITFVPVDIKHPLCLYYCGERIDLTSCQPDMPDQWSCLRAIASNPVACARFFHVMVTAFVDHILKAGSDSAGLFGKTESYYGTVESQGRLTLHLHLLLWIASSLSPQKIRDRVLDDNDFRVRLLSWLESCQSGDYLSGTVDDVAARIEVHSPGHSVSNARKLDGFRDPATCLPVTPPPDMNEHALEVWNRELHKRTDEIVYVSNRHDPRHLKGCVRGKHGVCCAQFPRELYVESVVDPESGAIQLKKHEAWINTYNPVLTYVLRCNSDVTSLLSGTQVKAVIAYITDYVTKTSLNTHTFFDTVRTVLQRNPSLLNAEADSRLDSGRRLISKIVNALTATQETGGPAVCAYLLGNPDHYTDRQFKTFYWRTYFYRAVGTAYGPDARFVGESE